MSQDQLKQAESAVIKVSKSEEISQMRELLMQAQVELKNSHQLANKIVIQAKLDADKIRQEAALSVQPVMNNFATVKKQSISIEAHGVTLTELLSQIMPSNWRVLIDIKDKSIQAKRISFISTQPRDIALKEITRSLNLEYRYYFNLKDELGMPSPLLVVASASTR